LSRYGRAAIRREVVDVSGAVKVPLGEHAYIYPGLINLHDHPFYDMLPLWQLPSSHVAGVGGPHAGH
jgi:hypothetical protein